MLLRIFVEALEVREGVELVMFDPVRRGQHGQRPQHCIGDRHALQHIDVIFEHTPRCVRLIELVLHFAEQRSREVRCFGRRLRFTGLERHAGPHRRTDRDRETSTMPRNARCVVALHCVSAGDRAAFCGREE